MKKSHKVSAVAAVLGTAMIGALSAGAYAAAETSPFTMKDVSSGLMVAGREGSCGEGKCGGNKAMEGKGTEGKCGSNKASEGKCGGSKAMEGKCGEGKCGSGKGATIDEIRSVYDEDMSP